jgi:hypothetical protein
MTVRGPLVRRLMLALVLVSGAFADPATASPKGRGAARKAAPAKAGTKKARPVPPRAEPAPARDQAPEKTQTAATGSEAIAQVDPAPPKASKPRVYTFGGLDVEGKLKAPQLLYFRSRMRQELDTSSAERRSFLKELEKTADEKGL